MKHSKTFAEECGELHEAWLELLEAALFLGCQRVLGWLTWLAVKLGPGLAAGRRAAQPSAQHESGSPPGGEPAGGRA